MFLIVDSMGRMIKMRSMQKADLERPGSRLRERRKRGSLSRRLHHQKVAEVLSMLDAEHPRFVRKIGVDRRSGSWLGLA